MADITDPEAVRFSNEKARTLADAAARYYYMAKAFTNEWDATGMGAKIPNAADTIIDGSATDGRSTITGANVNGMKTHVDAMVTDLEASSNTKLNILLQIEVNGSPAGTPTP